MLLWLTAASALVPHQLQLVDERGEPFRCATLTTVHHVAFTTDDTGVAALFEPGLMGQDVWLTPAGPGLVPPVDWLGLAGFSVPLREGGATRLTLTRDGPSPPCGRGSVEADLIASGLPEVGAWWGVQVVDAATGRPIPAVQVQVGASRGFTDNGGWVALPPPDGPVEVGASSYGYLPASPRPIDPASGLGRLTLTRVNLAERLVRLTGAGTWRDTLLVGQVVPAAEPLLDSGVLGQDTAYVVPFQGGLFWLWGDTNRASYPLGNFQTTAATSVVDPTPEDGVDLDYFEDGAGFVASVAPRFSEGPTWLEGLVALSDSELWAFYLNVDASFRSLHEGMVRWNGARFVERLRFGPEDVARPRGNAVLLEDPSGDPWIFWRSGVRAPADPARLTDPGAYQAWTPLERNGAGFRVALGPDGQPDWRWRTDAPTIDYDDVGPGGYPEGASPWHQALEPDTGETPVMHFGALAWHPGRDRWVHLVTESFGGPSLLGEIWLVEGDTPLGPWWWTRKVITHPGYSFYNVMLHPWFWSEGGDRILFEGTYTAWLASDPPTPRHDYNQQLYALDLTRPELALPVAYYPTPDGPQRAREVVGDVAADFGAWEAEFPGSVPVRWTGPDCAPRALTLAGEGPVAFWALPLGSPGPERAPLRPWTLPDGTTRWSARDLGALGAVAGPPLVDVLLPRSAAPAPLTAFLPPERAQAGPDRCAVRGPVALDGSASHLADGVVEATWSWSGGVAEGLTTRLELPPGLHAVTLTVRNAQREATDQVLVEVLPPEDTAAPEETGALTDTAGASDTSPPGETGGPSETARPDETGAWPAADPAEPPRAAPAQACGCASARWSTAPGALLAGMLLLRRRRRWA